jgi:hypothetical protein
MRTSGIFPIPEHTAKGISEARQTPCGSPGLVSPLVQAASAGS